MDEKFKKMAFLQELETVLDLCWDFYLGVGVKRKYIKKWTRESDNEFERRLDETNFHNYVSSSVNIMADRIMDGSPIEVSGLDRFDLKNIDNKNHDLHSFIRGVCVSALVYGATFIVASSKKDQRGVFFKEHKYIDLLSFREDEGKLTEITFKEKRRWLMNEESVEVDLVIKYTVGGGRVYNEGKLLKKYSWENPLDEIPIVVIGIGEEVDYLHYIPSAYNLAGENLTLLKCVTQSARLLSMIANPIPSIHGNFMSGKQELGRQAKMYKEVEEGTFKLDSHVALCFQKGMGDYGFKWNYLPADLQKASEASIERAEKNCEAMSYNILNRERYHTVKDAEDNAYKANPMLRKVAEELENKFSRLLDYSFDILGTKRPKSAKILFRKNFESGTLQKEQAMLLSSLLNAGGATRKLVLKALDNGRTFGEGFDMEDELKSKPLIDLNNIGSKVKGFFKKEKKVSDKKENTV